MKTIVSVCAFGCALMASPAMATTYTCVNPEKNVEFLVNLVSDTSAEVEVKSPFQAKLTCEWHVFTKGSETAKGIICGDGDGIPDIVGIYDKTMKGFIEVRSQPHYDVNCK